MKKENVKKIRGFTIIEMMIAIAIFLVVVVFGMQSLLNANFVQKKSQSMRSLYDSLTFALDDMSKNIRVGSSYFCITEGTDFYSIQDEKTKSCKDGLGISFESSTGTKGNGKDQWVYFISENKLYKSTGPSYSGVDNFAVQMTPDEVVLGEQASGFSVLGAEPPSDDKQQPLVIIRLVGSVRDIPFSIETAVSQRLIDIETNPTIIPVTPITPVAEPGEFVVSEPVLPLEASTLEQSARESATLR
ncbi:MAG TPA: prepilin-type N-terminal cleavage/methylation domain-containing protein [Candidatus Paceibacterota bacterium]|nr:prepilin-type N-terminal cleavage/methylation domain-containing protein [Candidatus Paceibacterota bacterium]